VTEGEARKAMSETEKPTQGPTEAAPEPEPITFAEFLENVPPSQLVNVTNLWAEKRGYEGRRYNELQSPQLQLHCTSDECNGLRFFRYQEGSKNFVSEDDPPKLLTYITYLCSNCRKKIKTYSLHAVCAAAGTGQCYKFGEFPPYGPPTPARLIRLFGKDREIFLKGRQCENHGLGIGAFVYYRRVVENHKSQILDEIIRVSKKIGAPPETLTALEAAKKEIQFSKALTSVKDAVPQALLINGQNPLTLLHSALSVGLHEQTDETCLALAHDVRVVLIELAERLSQALKDEAELNAAISRLMNVKQEK
jgi:hypothetical protein